MFLIFFWCVEDSHSRSNFKEGKIPWLKDFWPMPHTSVAHDCYPRHVATRGACAALPCGLWRPHCGRTNGTRGCYVARTAVEGSGWVPPKVRKPWGSGPIAWRQDLGYSWEPCFYSPSALLEAESRTREVALDDLIQRSSIFRLGSEAQVHVNPPRSLPFCQLKSQVVEIGPQRLA